MTDQHQSMNLPMPHVGNLIEDVMKDRKMSLTNFAKKMGSSAAAIRQLLNRESIQTDKLWKASTILEYNFFQEIGNKHPIQSISKQEVFLHEQISDLQKENELMKSLLRR